MSVCGSDRVGPFPIFKNFVTSLQRTISLSASAGDLLINNPYHSPVVRVQHGLAARKSQELGSLEKRMEEISRLVVAVCGLGSRLSDCLFVVLGLRISGLGCLLVAVKAGAVHPSRMSRDYGLTRAFKMFVPGNAVTSQDF